MDPPPEPVQTGARVAHSAARRLEAMRDRVKPALLDDTLISNPAVALLGVALASAIFLLLCFHFVFSSQRGKARTSSSSRAAKRSDVPTVLLVGPEATGKTSLLLSLCLGTVPSTHPSQTESETTVEISRDHGGQDAEKSVQRSLHLVDLPGHPRLRPKLNDYLPAADAIVFCLDAASTVKAASLATGQKSSALTDAVDHLHALLTSLAKARLSRYSSTASSRPPPALLIVLTRADLAPLLSGDAAAAADEKRRTQLLSRARSALEAELAKRRAAMGLGGPRGSVASKVGAMGAVAGGGGTEGAGLLARLRGLLGLGIGGGSGAGGAGQQDEDADEEEEESFDYVDWHSSASASLPAGGAGRAGAAGASTRSVSFDRLDEDVVQDGRAHVVLASVGQQAKGWLASEKGVQVGQVAAAAAAAAASSWDGTRELRSWLASL